MKLKGPRVLLFDIETAPIVARVWGLWDQNVALNQIEQDWTLLSWAAKWLHEGAVMYQDQSGARDVRDDKKLAQGIWKLLDEADVVVTQNGKEFDVKKLNARFIIHGFEPPSSYKHIDTLKLAKKHFGFTSNKLEYLSNTLNRKHKKLVAERKFPGNDLWTQCLAGNADAWREMKKYNCYDVLALEELYTRLIPWDNSINFNLYHDDLVNVCKCGSERFKKYGFAFTATGKFQRYKCLDCGAETRGTQNLLTKEKRQSLRTGTGSK